MDSVWKYFFIGLEIGNFYGAYSLGEEFPAGHFVLTGE